MQVYRSAGAAVALAAALCGTLGTTWAAGQVPKTLSEFGEPVYPSYEGWYDNPDGSYTLLMGYFNPNTKQTVRVPIGESNFIAPGAPDQGQPTVLFARTRLGYFHDPGAGRFW